MAGVIVFNPDARAILAKPSASLTRVLNPPRDLRYNVSTKAGSNVMPQDAE